MSTVRECILDGAYIYAQLEFGTEAVENEIQKMIHENLTEEAHKAAKRLFEMGLIGERLINQTQALLESKKEEKIIKKEDLRIGTLLWAKTDNIYHSWQLPQWGNFPVIVSELGSEQDYDWFKIKLIGQNLDEFDFKFRLDQFPLCLSNHMMFGMEEYTIEKVKKFLKEKGLKIKNKSELQSMVENSKKIMETIFKLIEDGSKIAPRKKPKKEKSQKKYIRKISMDGDAVVEINITDEACGKFSIDGKPLKNQDRFFDTKINLHGTVIGVDKKGVLFLSLDEHKGKVIPFDLPENVLNKNFVLL